MTKRNSVVLATLLAASLSLTAAGCSKHDESSSRPSTTSSKGPGVATGTVIGGTPQRGGTLTILSNQDFSHLDPARNWVMPAMDFGTRLLYRTLTTFQAAPGTAGGRVVPDLATDLGRSSDGGRVWTFTLKTGLKYEDGTPITSKDIKYNVERSFSPDLTGGPGYAREYLAGTKGYTGPLQGRHLSSIVTPDDRTIVFHLNRPVAEFSSTATLPTFAPVPQAKETGVQYDLRPFSSGPYKIESYKRGKQMVLVRNTFWSQDTDDVRKAYPDRIVVTMGLQGAQIDDRLIASKGADASSVEWADMSGASVAKVLPHADLRARLSAEPTGCTDMLYLNTAHGPFTDPDVRLAMQYAIDKSAQVTANGGPALNDIADHYLPPLLTGGFVAPVFDVPPAGNPGHAKELLAKAGKSSFSATLTVSTGDKTRAEALQASLAKVGVKVQINTVDASVFYDAIGDTAHAPDMTISGWCPDYPSGATFLPFLFDGRTIVPKGNQGNYSQFRDTGVEQRMDEIQRMPNTDEANVAWKSLDAQIMRQSPAVPLLWPRKPLLVGTNIAGAYGHSAWTGQFDFAVIGLKDPAKSQG